MMPPFNGATAIACKLNPDCPFKDPQIALAIIIFSTIIFISWYLRDKRKRR